MANLSYGPKVYTKQGGATKVVASGGALNIESGATETVESGGVLNVASGGALQLAGVDVTTALTAQKAQSSGTQYETVAAAGSTQGDATAMSADFVLVSAADATKGVILPAPVAGRVLMLKNNANAVLKVYPATGGAINALSANGAISLAALVGAVFVASSTTQWFTIPLLPS